MVKAALYSLLNGILNETGEVLRDEVFLGQHGLPVPARHCLCLPELPDHTVHHVEILLLLEALDCTHAADVVQTLLQLLHLILVVFNPT